MAVPEIYRIRFNITGAFTVAPAIAGRTYKVVGLSVHNNETVDSNQGTLRITAAALDVYGGSSAAIKLSGRGDSFFLPFNVVDPYFSTSVGEALFLFSQVSSRRLSGIIYYTVSNA